MLQQWPTLAKRYLAADEAGKRALLANTVDRLPLPDVAAMTELGTRGDVRGLGWLASASDICRVYAALAELSRRPGLSPIAQVLSINDDILELDPAQWKTTWRKGGIGPGILALAYLATTQTGQSYVVTLIAENRSQPLDPNTAYQLVAAARRRSALNVAAALPLIVIALTAFRAQQRWAWWTLLVGNTVALGAPMAYDQVTGAIGIFEVGEWVVLGAVYVALAFAWRR